MREYQAFLESKKFSVLPSGMSVDDIHPVLFPFQRDITRWALRMGKACIFADCGLGKSLMQLEWARHVGNVLVLAPLAVAPQLAREAELKKSYFDQAVINLTNAAGMQSGGLFGGVANE